MSENDKKITPDENCQPDENRQPDEQMQATENQSSETTEEVKTDSETKRGTVQQEQKKAKKAERRARKPQVDQRNRTLRSLSVVSIVFVVVVAILLNVLLQTFVGDSLRFDWSANQVMSLGETSEELLDELEQDVEIIVLTTRDALGSGQLDFVPELLEEYASKSDGHISIEYVNPTVNPNIYNELDPDNVNNLQAGMVVVRNPESNRIRALSQSDFVQTQFDQQSFQQYVTGYSAEQALSGAIKVVTAEYTPMVYVTTGHGEADPTSSYSVFLSVLRNNNIDIETYNGMLGEPVPNDAEALLMLAPSNDITETEVDIYLDYLRSGGSLIAMIGFSGTSFPNLNRLLQEFNMQVTDNRVVEGDSNLQYQQEAESFIAHSPSSTILPSSLGYSSSPATLVMNARGITQAQSAEEWITTENVLTTSAEGAYQIAGDPENLSASAQQVVAMYSENRGWIDGSNVTDPARVLVYGSEMVFSDNVLNAFGYSSLNLIGAFQSVSTMVDLEQASSSNLMIPARPVVNYYVNPTNPSSLVVAAVFTVVVIPLAMIIAAIVVYRRRKNL